MNKNTLNITRGKPCKEQLDLSLPLLDVLDSKVNPVVDDVDIRNYGELSGLKCAKKLMSEIAGCEEDNLIVYGNSSLDIMYQLIADSFSHGVLGNEPFFKQGKIKWLCVVPGYDRHFAICEHFGFEMINVPLKEDGPDMDKVEELIKDPSVKGIWCVPMYSNPTGITFSDEVVRRFARLKPAAKDFRIYWDNAYALHHLYEDRQDKLLNLLNECEKAGNPNLVYEFYSTSKVTFAGGGIAALATSLENKKSILENLIYKTIGNDKVNQYRHVLYLKDINNVKSLMKKHADIIRPKFDLVESIFEKELKGIATWSKPNGGYFITLYVKGVAKEVIAMCKERGLVLTDAGCAFPYHKDPNNTVIRIAPTYPSLSELERATQVLCDVVKLLRK